jgi:predicted alpha/beta superfamily hydrolase
MKNLFNIILLLVTIVSCQSNLNTKTSNSDEKPKVDSLTIGSKYIFKSKLLSEDRPIIVSLPKNYSTSNANYPVLYLTDGMQNIWHTIGTIEVLTRTGSIPPLIVVGIESTNRTRDFTFTNSDNNPESGGGLRFLDFIENELIPHIETNYRVNSFRVLEGHSLGGLFTASVLMEKPKLFDAHIIMSPSFWCNKEETTGKAKLFFKANPDLEKTIFFGIGTYESGVKWGMRKELTNFIDVIKANQPEKLRFKHKEMEMEGHMSSPLLSAYYGLKFVFSDMAFTDDIYDNYTDIKFLRHENNIMTKYGEEAKQSAEEYIGLAFQLINEEKKSNAITVLKRSVEAYDFDINIRMILANTYEKNNDIKNSIKTYKKAVEMSIKYKLSREEEIRKHISRLENN